MHERIHSDLKEEEKLKLIPTNRNRIMFKTDSVRTDFSNRIIENASWLAWIRMQKKTSTECNARSSKTNDVHKKTKEIMEFQ